MKDSLLTESRKKEILKLIKQKKYSSIVSILEKIKTGHAGTAKTKDKRFVVREIVKQVIENSSSRNKDFFDIGFYFCKRKESVSREIGVSLIWRGYSFNSEIVKEILIKIADDGNWEVREYAATAFANTLYHNHSFYKDVLKLTKHHSENVRRAVLFAALGFKDSRNLNKAYKIIEPLLFDNSKYVRKNLGPFILGSHFGNSFPEETISQLKKWSKIRDENVRWNVIMSFNNSFGNKHPEDAFNFIKYFAGDVDLTVKRAVLSTLNFLRKRHEKKTEEFIRKNKIKTDLK